MVSPNIISHVVPAFHEALDSLIGRKQAQVVALAGEVANSLGAVLKDFGTIVGDGNAGHGVNVAQQQPSRRPEGIA